MRPTKRVDRFLGGLDRPDTDRIRTAIASYVLAAESTLEDTAENKVERIQWANRVLIDAPRQESAPTALVELAGGLVGDGCSTAVSMIRISIYQTALGMLYPDDEIGEGLLAQSMAMCAQISARAVTSAHFDQEEDLLSELEDRVEELEAKFQDLLEGLHAEQDGRELALTVKNGAWDREHANEEEEEEGGGAP